MQFLERNCKFIKDIELLSELVPIYETDIVNESLVRFECDNVVIPVSEIEEKFPGGYEAFKEKFPLDIHLWYDGNLVRFGDDPYMSDWLKDLVGYGIKPYTFQKELPKEWKMYPPEFIKGCAPKLMWTNEYPEESLKLEDGRYMQGGLIYSSYYIWQKANRWLVNWDNPNCLLYHWGKGGYCKWVVNVE